MITLNIYTEKWTKGENWADRWPIYKTYSAEIDETDGFVRGFNKAYKQLDNEIMADRDNNDMTKYEPIEVLRVDLEEK